MNKILEYIMDFGVKPEYAKELMKEHSDIIEKHRNMSSSFIAERIMREASPPHDWEGFE